MTMLDEVRAVVANVAVPHQEWPSMIRRRRVVVCVVLVIGAVLVGLSLTRRPGDTTFYWLTFALAAVWAFGAWLSGPLHLGCIRWRGRNQRPVFTGIVVGLLLGGVFVIGGLAAREIGPVAERITRVLEYTSHGSLWLVVVITVVNGFAEELFFRGALYPALGGFHPVVISTLLYTAATCASGNPMLGFAAVILGTVCAWERRATGGVLAPVLTHMVWGLIMVLALPPMFGVGS
ncbi:CPBP family intramembrane glutamic endopeptidase [Mycobacterium sp. shizuoka-1]|uniref:CPBP family intramembrane glutamic endopeptidase n=1 Tax=Mycobacterium sp. shizuoka-1 TaxID=2039281 RepID=UPI000C05E633|nr:CPBP family intramembrane glutamic endopeptidase [Mycobacterium sp. shizuoka-1]GAY17703.1 CAAX protease family protein [Mycobacterium sp. shizuoka-1]